MRIVLQRVTSASVSVDREVIAGIDAGLLLLVGFGREDTDPALARVASRIVNLRGFPDRSGKLQHSVLETGGGVLAVPQFTLYGDTAKGRRPDFTGALTPERARDLFDRFVIALRETGIERLEAGRFGADMAVALVNDGPLTLMLEF
ncbi:MAG: D-aminoacyl-tRNA deacylase [Pseudomonadota bacterium]|nr:D-aminoacyl-tRNA deacylase [Pseudomonadota bacterium]